MTQSIATARIKREFKEVVTSDEVDIYIKKRFRIYFVYFNKVALFLFKLSKCKIKLELLNDNFTELKGEIGGPPDTPVSFKFFWTRYNGLAVCEGRSTSTVTILWKHFQVLLFKEHFNGCHIS